MLLRSSSTPVLSSLLPSFSDSSSNNSTHHEINPTVKHRLHSPASTHHSHNKLSFGSFNLPTVSCNSSPLSPSIAGFSGIRRAQSEGNLEGLAYASCKNEEDFCNTNQPSNKKFSGRNNYKCLMLETIPSFSYSTLTGRREDESDLEDYEEEMEEYLDENDEELLEINGKGAESCLKKEKMSTVVIEEVNASDKIWNGFEGESGMVGQEMHLAKGLGIGSTGGGGGGGGTGGGSDEFNWTGSGGDSGDNHEVEEYYKRMVEDNPGNPLFLGNYAQFLHQTNRDLHRAENYYSRAILADPGDGEILSQYAKLIWELHRDEDRAASYFERAVQASPQDSYVHAAYAGFLWETEEDDDECTAPSDLGPVAPQFHRGAVASANA